MAKEIKVQTVGCGEINAQLPNSGELDYHAKTKSPFAPGYLEPLYTPARRKTMVDTIVKALRKHSRKFQAIAISGYSTAMIAPIVASRLKKNLILVRKDSESRHSSRAVEGVPRESYIIIDDMIASGATCKFIEERVRTVLEGKLYGIYLYSSGSQYSVDSIFPGKGIKFLG